MKSPNLRCSIVLIVLGLCLPMALPAFADVIRIDRIPRIYALEVSREHSGDLYLATPLGLLRASPDGAAERLAGIRGEVTSLVVHPELPLTLFVGGHAHEQGYLGLQRSDDGGRTWVKVGDGADGPALFLGLDVSAADPAVIYGEADALQVSRDGGQTWTAQGSLPGRTYDFAVSATDPETLYAATDTGISRSCDGGRTWASAHPLERPAPMVHTAGDGTIYAFIVGAGLVRAKEEELSWETLSNDFGKRVLLRLAVDPADADRLFAVADSGAVVTSRDGGRTWIGYEGHDKATPERIARGTHLFRENCQSCHGVNGAGEPPENRSGPDIPPAPALDDTAHAWHHPDDDLVGFILEGSQSRGGRMPGFRETLDRADTEDIVAYFKSLWSFQSYACQGARHMACFPNLHGPGK